MELLTEGQIADELATVPHWTRDGGQLTRRVQRADFRDALLYVNAVGYLAERANHHPDITIAWNRITLTLSTHSAGGLTPNDFALARQIDTLLAILPRVPRTERRWAAIFASRDLPRGMSRLVARSDLNGSSKPDRAVPAATGRSAYRSYPDLPDMGRKFVRWIYALRLIRRTIVLQIHHEA